MSGAAGTAGQAAGGTTDPGAGAGSLGGAAPPASTAGSAPSGDWTTGFNDDLKGYVQNKGFKDSASVVESYRNFEKLIGVPQERVLKLPTKEDDPAWNDVYDRLGRPKDPKEYKIDVPKELGDEKFSEWAKGTFHKLGISKAAGEKLAAEWTARVQSEQKARVDAHNAQLTGETDSLKKEWGLAHDKYMAMAKQAATSFNVDGKVIDQLSTQLGFTGVMKLFQQIGEKMGEGNFVSGGSGTGGFGNVMAPEAARNRINALRHDSDFVRRYTSGEVGARDEMDRLHKMAYPD